MPPTASLALLALLALGGPHRSAAQCSSGGTYAFGGASCSACPPGATLISATAGCTPSTTAWAGPYDSSFTLSGTQSEGLAAFASVTAPLGVTYTSSVFNAGPSNGALTLATGSYITVPGASAPPTLPTGNSPWSASAWVKCAAPTTYAAVLEWGAASDANGVLTQSSIALAVTGAYAWNVQALANKGTVSTLAGSALGYGDGVGTSAGLQSVVDMHMDQSTGTLIVVEGTQTGNNWVVRRVGLDGTVSTIAGNPNMKRVPLLQTDPDMAPPPAHARVRLPPRAPSLTLSRAAAPRASASNHNPAAQLLQHAGVEQLRQPAAPQPASVRRRGRHERVLCARPERHHDARRHHLRRQLRGHPQDQPGHAAGQRLDGLSRLAQPRRPRRRRQRQLLRQRQQ